MMDAKYLSDRLAAAPPDGVVTEYDGVTFRSKLESLWYAKIKDDGSWEITYEPRVFKHPTKSVTYLPDFRLRRRARRSGVQLFVEVKPTLHDPVNAIHLIGRPMMLIAGYPDGQPECMVVTFEQSKYDVPQCPSVRTYHLFGGDWKAAAEAAVTAVVTGARARVPSLDAVGGP